MSANEDVTATGKKRVIYFPILHLVQGSMNILPSPQDDTSELLLHFIPGQSNPRSVHFSALAHCSDNTQTSTVSHVGVSGHRNSMQSDEGRNDRNDGRNLSSILTRDKGCFMFGKMGGRHVLLGMDKDRSMLGKNGGRDDLFIDPLEQTNQDEVKAKTVTARDYFNVKRYRKARSSVTPDVSTRSQKQDSLDSASFLSPDSKRDAREATNKILGGSKPNLLDLTFTNLRISPLANISPTSFLTGKQDEVLRTCEYEAAPFQMEIPSCRDLIVAGLLNEFVDNYRRIDQNLDLQDWVDRSAMITKHVDVKEHIPIAQLLLECGDDVIIRGFVSAGTDCDERIEAVIFEGQRNFTVALRGSTEQQARSGFKPTTKRSCFPICLKDSEVEIFATCLDEYQKIETKCFDTLDRLTEEHPFCDVVFTGYSFGGALATLAAAMYANARPMVRVQCYPMGSPKVGSTEFRRIVNSSPNLRVIRLEYGQDGKCQFPSQHVGVHVGHTLVLSPLLGKNTQKIKDPILAYKFEAPKLKKFKTIHPDLRCYVTALEEITRLNLPWVTEFVGTTGRGVVVGDESRQMV